MEEDLKKKYMEMQVVDQQVKQMQQQAQALDTQVQELTAVSEALDDLKKVEKGTEILVPLSSGIFAKAEIKDSENLIVNVGADITVQRTVPETKNMIDDQLKEMEKIKDTITLQVQQMMAKAKSIETDMRKLVGK